ncbi:MAG: HelD family protein [Christensenellales bacterium]|jgi:DNA helicase-2/ATP-dependent DNA helicase PcrA
MQRHELDRFQKTLEVVKAEYDAAEKDRLRLVPIVDELFKQINRSEDYNAYVEYQLHELLLSRASMSARSLHLAKLQPYFTRIDFEPRDKDGDIGGTYYIGKYGVVDSASMESVVVDWRAPIANLYYSGQIGSTHYVTPDGKIEGDLTLKRQFNIESGVLKSYYDADVVSQDKLLGEVLGSVSQGKLKEVVTTIQAEQNAVIRHPMNKSLIVQGVAGSGKTTIALHRIAYLLYAYQKTLLPRCLMILAPNPLFLDYISSVLPDLGVQDVHQLTFKTLCEKLMDEDGLPKIAPDDRLVRALSSAEDAESIAKACEEKGSVEYLTRIDAFLDEIEEEICPKEDIAFGPVMVYSREQLRQMILVDMKPQPVNARIQALIRHSKGRIKEAAKKVEEMLIDDSVRRADHIRARLEDGPQRRQRLQKLYSSRDERIAEAKKEAPKFARALAKRWKPLSAKELYARFLGVEKLKTITEDDLPAIIWIQRRINGLKKDMRLMHIIIDEAQDYSAAQLHLLSAVFNRPGYTLVGDMGQNIHFYRNISGWEVALSVVPEAQVKSLVTSYRTTIEIMQEANKVAARHPYPGQVAAKPVLRSGEAPLYLHAKSEKERVRLIGSQVKRMREELHYNSVCIIESSPARAKALSKLLEGVSLLDHLSSSYSSGAYVASIDQIKGLEFDAVIIADAGEGQYPDLPQHARLLYVAMTRPLHRLSIVYTGKLSPLFGCPGGVST